VQIQSKQISFKIEIKTETFCSIHPSLLGRQPDLKRLPAQLSKSKDVQTSIQACWAIIWTEPRCLWGLNLSVVLRISHAAALMKSPLALSRTEECLGTKAYAGFILRAASYMFRLCLYFLESPSYRNIQELCLPFTSALHPLFVFPTV